MSNPITDTPTGLSDVLKIVLGAIIALLSSIVIEGLKVRINKQQQVNFFKSTLIEDLSEICELIHDMRETYTQTQLVKNTYLTGMFEIEKKFSTSRHDNLYLIRNENLRKEVKDLFKSLNSKIKDSTNKVEKLGETNDGHNQIITDFTALESTIKTLKDNIKKHKYCIFFII